MDEIGLHYHLQRVDPARNMRRFYTLSVERDLFGEPVLVRRWGRIGTFGQTRRERFSTFAAAKAELQAWRQAKLRKGYC